MPYYPSKRSVEYNPALQQWVVRTHTVPYGYQSYGPFDDANTAANWAADRDWAPHNVDILPATERSAWKSMKDPDSVPAESWWIVPDPADWPVLCDKASDECSGEILARVGVYLLYEELCEAHRL